jgi:serine/threonine-protein kinase
MPAFGPPPYPPQDGTPRTLSLLASIGLAAGTAAVVIFIGVFIAIRPNSSESTAPSATSPNARVESIAQKPPELAPLPPLPPPNAPAASPAPAPSPAPGNAVLPVGYGHLTVTFPSEGDVYVSGKLLGPVNQPLQVLCGRWFVRVGTHKSGRYPDWLTVGRTVSVPCQDATQISMAPRR